MNVKSSVIAEDVEIAKRWKLVVWNSWYQWDFGIAEGGGNEADKRSDSS